MNPLGAGSREVAETHALDVDVLLDLLFEDAHVGRCLVASNGNVLRANLSWLRSTGFDPVDGGSADILQLFGLLTETREEALAMHARLRAGQRVEVPRRPRRIDGRETWFGGTIDPVPMDGGSGLLITIREVPPDPEQDAEATAGAGEARFQTLAEESPVMLWARDAHGHPEFVNRAFREFFGVTSRDVEGPGWRPPVHPEDAPLLEELVRTALHGREAFRRELRVRRADGEWRWIATYGQPRHGKAGEYLGHVGVHVDITDRKRAEDALRLSEQKFRVSIANAAVGFALTTPEGAILEANPAFCALTGYAVEELRNMRPAQLVHPDDHAENKRLVDRLIRGELPAFVLENRYLRKGGDVLWVRKSVSMVRDERSAPLWAIALVEDISERKRMEEMLRSTLQRFYGILSSMYSPVLLATNDGGLEFANPAFCEVFRLEESPAELMGLRSSEVIEKTLATWLHPEEQAARMLEIIRRGEPVKGEEVPFRDGRTFLRDCIPLTVDGEPHGRLWLHYDITDRKRAEEALREEDRRKAEFLAVLSHELRNPLAPIRNSIVLLERSAPGTKQATQAREVIRRQTEHLTRLVDDLLDVTRVARGKIVLKPTRVDLRDIVRKTTDDLRSVFVQAGVELHVEDVLGPAWITADPTRITQVLGNLLHNAVKFTPTGGSITVTVAAKGDHAELRVRDTGVGMEPEAIERMFVPFVQAEMTLARTKGGLGLGLPLVKGLVELHGGRVEARSEGIGHGSEFLVHLPLAESSPGPERRPQAAAAAGPREILVIEDNLDAGETLAAILELQGHRVRVARDGRSGLALAHELRPDVVLCDIGLPDIDGYEVARALRRDEALRATRLVALSGYAQPEDKRLAREAGFDAHLAKPAEFEELASVLASDA